MFNANPTLHDRWVAMVEHGWHSTWTADEDQLLRNAADHFGSDNPIEIFQNVSGRLQGRTIKQVSGRLQYVYSDGIEAHRSRNAAGLTKKEVAAILT